MGSEERAGSRDSGAPAAGSPEEAHWGAWMEAAQRGDASAYRKLLQEILPVLRRLVRSRLFDETLAEDVLQTAMLHIHRARHTYQPSRPFGPWMRTIARNAVVDALRAQGRRATREIIVEELETLPQATVAAKVDGESEALSPKLRAALDALPAKQREAVELIHLEGLSVAAAAVRAGVTPGALKVRAHRGYKVLRSRLGSREEAEE